MRGRRPDFNIHSTNLIEERFAGIVCDVLPHAADSRELDVGVMVPA